MLSNKVLYKIHGWLGLIFGLFLFIVCFSGSFATLSSEIDWLINTDMRAPERQGEIQWQKMAESIREEYPRGDNLGIYKYTYFSSLLFSRGFCFSS